MPQPEPGLLKGPGYRPNDLTGRSGAVLETVQAVTRWLIRRYREVAQGSLG
jgi:hypothetical protein